MEESIVLYRNTFLQIHLAESLVFNINNRDLILLMIILVQIQEIKLFIYIQKYN